MMIVVWQWDRVHQKRIQQYKPQTLYEVGNYSNVYITLHILFSVYERCEKALHCILSY